MSKQLEEDKERFREQQENQLQEIRIRLVRGADELQKEIKDALYELKKSKSEEKLEKARQALNEMRAMLQGKEWQPSNSVDSAERAGQFSINERVWLSGLGVQGVITALPDNSGQLEIQIGKTRVKMLPENLEKVKGEKLPAVNYRSAAACSRRAVSYEYDLRGRRADEVEIELDSYLNDASLANLPAVRIIHGIGGGTVRQIVRQYLASHPLFNSFRSGKREEGGDGVTVVNL